MLDPSSVFAYKSCFQIAPALPGDSAFLETLYTVIYRDIIVQSDAMLDFRQFRYGMSYKSEDDTLMLRTAFLRSQDLETSPCQWAMLFRFRDHSVRRRSWTLQVGLSWQKSSSVAFNLSLHYSDHQAGSMAFLTPPAIQPPALLQKLLHHPALSCFSGTSRIPVSPLHLMDEDFPDFFQRLFDSARTFPIVLITCPDLIKPSILYTKSLGNLIVCWLDDYLSYKRLCEQLPSEMQFPWDAVKIFMPVTAKQLYHPTLSVESITSMGSEAALDGICRAYCICPTGAERRAFVTLDGLYSLFREQSAALLHSENERLQQECERLNQANQTLSQNQAQLSAQLDACKSQISQLHDTSWEDLLNESLQENEKIKKGLSQIITSMFDNLNNPLLPDDLDNCPELHELAVAIRTFRNLLINHSR